MLNRSRLMRSDGASCVVHGCSYRENKTKFFKCNASTTGHCFEYCCGHPYGLHKTLRNSNTKRIQGNVNLQSINKLISLFVSFQ